MADIEQLIVELLQASAAPQAIGELESALALPRRTLQRHLSGLVSQQRVLRVGRGRGTRYQLLAPDGGEGTSRPVGWDASFLEDYQPNVTSYLDPAISAQLRAIGSPASTLPVGTYARRILDRLLIDLSWNSSRLEGNTYSLLDTEELLLNGRTAEGRSPAETQMILNHKAAIEFIVADLDELAISPIVLRNVHALLSENLLADPSDGGRLRSMPVGITGSSYIPLANPHRIDAAFLTVVEKMGAIDDPFEASFFALVQIPYLQPFVDVNKRVARLAANIPFIQAGLYPLSFLDTPRDAYLRAILQIYEHRDVAALRELFVTAYRRSGEKYAVIAQSLGDPDPFRLRFRSELKEAVARVVREGLDVQVAVDALELSLADSERARLYTVVSEELNALHEGNFARYRLRPSEFEQFKRHRATGPEDV